MLWALDKLVGRGLKHIKSPFPSSVASIFVAIGILGSIQLTVGKRSADRCLNAMQPGVNFLGKWMLLCIAVTLVNTPLALRTATQWPKMIAVTGAGWLFTLISTAGTVKALTAGSTAQLHNQSVRAPNVSGSHDDHARAALTHRAKESLQVEATLRHRASLNRSAWSAMTGLSLMLLPWLGIAPAQACTTVLALLHANRVPPWLVQVGLHPLLLTAAATWLVSGGLASLQGVPYASVSSKFFARRGLTSGPGDFLYEPMNAALVALGCRVFGMRSILAANLTPIAIGTTLSTVCSLFGTVAMGRLLRLTSANSLLLSQRCTSGGFAMLVCGIIGIDSYVPLMFMFNLASGLLGGCVGPWVLDKIGCRGDQGYAQQIARGVSMGAASHATGTASLIQNGEANTAAMASVSVVVCGMLHSCIVSVAPLRRVLLTLAG
jgi:putative effector of murein hydrolase